ncbi:MAG: hypothetical protein JWL72_156 [Ilumatobacteraceae bacterium]|nr:hypothetical protein [Ilumatobacteraceae bacterium]MCU1386818.1 hypothetical protein [Ilumatobacteraceae bacterium]
MSYIDLIVERQIAEAIARGEMGGGPLQGKPLADLGSEREPGWWAARTLSRERSAERRREADIALAQRRNALWAADSRSQLIDLVAETNAWIETTNATLQPIDAIPALVLQDCDDTWAALRAYDSRARGHRRGPRRGR